VIVIYVSAIAGKWTPISQENTFLMYGKKNLEVMDQ
jgi:hypothetical protein